MRSDDLNNRFLSIVNRHLIRKNSQLARDIDVLLKIIEKLTDELLTKVGKCDILNIDGEMVKEPGLGRGEWITMHGARIFVGEDKKIKAGAEGKFNGENVEDFKQQENARDRIKDGTYNSKVVQGQQNKHLQGTFEFQQKRQSMKQIDTNNEPSILTANAQELVDRYKGTGNIDLPKGSDYPREYVKADKAIGKAWVKSLQKYVPTDKFVISYNKKGTHIYPINPNNPKA